MTKIKLIALDMDGTACSFHRGIYETNIMPIIKAQEMGIRVVFATGRPVLTSLSEAIKVKMDYFQQYFIGFNGACIYMILKIIQLFINKPYLLLKLIFYFN
ncbi:HAD family hydrolase [Spiroplasma citri]|uniref:HAD family hydrolase n=1 Tax=Spiroplasma citri TaxID=2133 RepID=UPI0009096F14|nr:HAD hydrolase family protein [Spiroplasma citri]APE74333.1 HAD family hydrolase [Spiroplasma citri]